MEQAEQPKTGTYEGVAPQEWANPPELSDLKLNYQEAQSAHAAQEQKIEEWLDNLHVRGAAKPPARKGRSSAQPKLIRKQAEWRYPRRRGDTQITPTKTVTGITE